MLRVRTEMAGWKGGDVVEMRFGFRLGLWLACRGMACPTAAWPDAAGGRSWELTPFRCLATPLPASCAATIFNLMGYEVRRPSASVLVLTCPWTVFLVDLLMHTVSSERPAHASCRRNGSHRVLAARLPERAPCCKGHMRPLSQMFPCAATSHCCCCPFALQAPSHMEPSLIKQ